MTEPLTPADCDLRGLSYMPLDVQRLRDSDLALISSGDEFKAAVLLWSASWAQVPAASLPDDDRLLAALVRLDAKVWRKVREVALRGWIKCSDGRLYHAVVAEKACDAWKDRETYRAKREKDKARLEAWRASQKQPSEQPGNGDGNADETHHETRFETQPEEKGTGSEGIIEPPKPPEGAFSPKSIEDGFEVAWTAYPEDGKATTNREFSLAAWRPVAAEIGPDRLAAAVRAFAASPVVTGPKAKTVPNFAAWLRNRRFETFLTAGGEASAAGWAGPPDLWELAVRRRDEAWAKGYLRPATIDGAVIRPATATAAKAITEVLGDDLADRGMVVIHTKSAPPPSVERAVA